MHNGFILGRQLPNRRLKSSTGGSFAGAPIGIILIEESYVMLPGNVANANTYDFPVLYHVLEGVKFEHIATAKPSVIDAVIMAGKALITNGARAVVGACGSFANYQRDAAARLEVPVFLSPMLQVPWIQASLQPSQKLLIIAANSSTLTPRVFEQCGITNTENLLIEQAEDLPEFRAMTSPGGFNPSKLEAELTEFTYDIVKQHPEAGAILLQCSDLPPFAGAIQGTCGLPVFDMNTLVHWIYSAIVRKPYDGII